MTAPNERPPGGEPEAFHNDTGGASGKDYQAPATDPTTQEEAPGDCISCGGPAVWQSPTGHWACDKCRSVYAGDHATRQLLDDVYRFLGRFVAYPSEAAHVAHALWVLHTHLMDCWESTPRIAFLSPEPASGKTRALEVTELLVPNPVEAVNVTPAYLFRKVGDEAKPTILFDEIDTVFGPKARENEEIRGLLNAGHRRGAVAGRCIVRGRTVETEEIPAYSALALAGIGDLPDTIITRSVVVRMQRRAPTEIVEPYRRRVHCAEGEALRARIERWALEAANQVEGAYPEMPDGIEDRDADVWEPLLAVADAIGGEWPTRARVSAVSLVSEARETDGGSLGLRLLADLHAIWPPDGEAAFTETLLQRLIDLDESPWGDLRGRALDARGLAHRLRNYKVKSRQVRVGAETKKGYLHADLADLWTRYLSLSPLRNETRETNETSDTEERVTWEEQVQGVLDHFSLPPIGTETRETSETDRCRCGAEVQRFTEAGIPYCDKCGPPDTSPVFEKAAASLSAAGLDFEEVAE